MKETINKELTGYKITDGIMLVGNVKDISVDSFDLVPGALKVIGSVNGKLQVNIDDLKF
jgi:hypothetical protein